MGLKAPGGRVVGSTTELLRLYVRARDFVVNRFSKVPYLGPKTVELALTRKYGSRVITPRKVKNFIRVNEEMTAKAIEVSSLPYHMNMDLLNVCNLECPFCPSGTHQIDRKNQRLPKEQAKEIIDQVKDYIITLTLFHWGEPFLNPEIFEVARYAHDAGLYTDVHSNMSVKVENLGEKIVESRLDHLLVSMDGLEQNVAERYRRKVNNELLFDNVRDVVRARARAGTRKPTIDVAFLVFKHNEHEIPLLEAKRKELGVDSIIKRRAAIYHESVVPSHPDFQPLQEIFEDTCSFLYADLNVEPDGGISPCCFNHSKKWDMGRVEELADFRSFWNNPHLKAMRGYYGGKGDGGMELLCRYCEFVGNGKTDDRNPEGRLSPLPPSFIADGIEFNHGYGDRTALVQIER